MPHLYNWHINISHMRGKLQNEFLNKNSLGLFIESEAAKLAILIQY